VQEPSGEATVVAPERFPDIYRIHEERYAHGYGEGGVVSAVRERIEEGIGQLELGDRVRPDARLFLLANFCEMIVLPIERLGSTTGSAIPIEEDELFRRVTYDTITILSRAAEINRGRARRSEDDRISGHDVLDATSQKWDDLMLASRGFWLAFHLPTL